MSNLVTSSQEALKKGSRAVLYADEDQLFKTAEKFKEKGELFKC